MSNAGRKTDMTDELVNKIKQSILDGNDLRKTAKICEIDDQKLYNWKCNNYLNIGDKIENWQLKAKLLKAESRADEILSLSLISPDGKVDTGTASIVQKESQFIRETLDKPNYSKRTENTGADGKPLEVTVINYKNEDNNTI